MYRRREESYVGKVEVQGNEDPLLPPTGLDQFLISAACEILREDGVAIVTGVMKYGIGFARNILVELEAQPHSEQSGRYR